MSTHSPLPWRTYRNYENYKEVLTAEEIAEEEAKPHTTIVSADERTVVNAHDFFIFRAGDAEFIVQACNAYDDLVDALRAILFQIVQGKVLERDACITQARAAMKKAGAL
jgi:hypothetical protein